MEQLIWQELSNIVDAKTLIIIAGLYVIYRKLGTLEYGVRSGLLAHITRIHSATTNNNYISKDTFQIVTECYSRYKSLGGNGYADKLMADIKRLHFKDEKKK